MEMLGVTVVLMPQRLDAESAVVYLTQFGIGFLLLLVRNVARVGDAEVNLGARSVFVVRRRPAAFDIKQPAPGQAAVVHADRAPARLEHRIYNFLKHTASRGRKPMV